MPTGRSSTRRHSSLTGTVLEQPERSDLAGSALPTQLAARPWLGQTVGWVALLAFITWFLLLFIRNPNIDLPTIRRFLFDSRILDGLLSTIVLAATAMAGSLVVGALVGLGRVSDAPVPRTAAWLYVWLFRSTPLVVQILLWGNLSLLVPDMGFGPWTVSTNTIMTPFVSGVVALTLHEASYVAEIVRSGMNSVSRTQREAADALALSWWETQRYVVLPQALRVMIPPLGGVFVLLLKSTSLVIVIAGGDLLSEAQNIASTNLRTLELLIVATLWFLLVTSIAYAFQFMIEARFDRQFRPPNPAAKAGLG